jgi:hypothetical protein
MWIYEQKTGLMMHDGEYAGYGYSGHGEGVNNPALERVHNIGPIPRGVWEIGEFFDDLGGKGPIVAHLTPSTGTDTFGRAGMMVHGDNSAGDHSASHGCIVMPRVVRIAMRDSGDKLLRVV